MSETKKSVENTEPGKGFMGRVAWITGANFLSFLLSMATPFIIANLLAPAQVGLYKQAFLIVSIVTTMLNLQVASGGYYFIPQMPEKRFQIAFNILLFYFLVGSLVAALFFFYPQWSIVIFSSPEIIQYIPIVGLIILLWLMSGTFDLFPLALGDARTAAAFIVLSQILRSFTAIGATILYRNERAIIWAGVFQCSFQLLLVFWYLWRRYKPQRYYFDWPLFKAQVANAIPYGAGSIIFYLQSDMHNLFISHFFTPAVFAVYSVGCFQLPFLNLLTSSFSSVMFPEIARLGAKKDYSEIIAIWSESMRKLGLAFIPGCTLFYIVRHDFFAFLFPKEYAGAASIFAIYLLTILMTMPQTEPILRAFGEVKYFRLKLCLLLLPISIAALYAGMKVGGVTGVIVVVVLMQAVDLTITLRFILRHLGYTKKDLRRLEPMLWTALAGIMAGATAYYTRGLLPYILPIDRSANVRVFTAICLIISGMVFLITYLMTAFALGAITESELDDFSPVLAKIRQFVPARLWKIGSDLRAYRRKNSLGKEII